MAGVPRSVGEEFIAHRLFNPLRLPAGAELPRPLNMQEYVKDIPPNQTKRCTDLAVAHYNNQLQVKNDNQGHRPSKLTRAMGEHSNMFILTNDDPMSYYHVYFKAYEGRKEKYFFAELAGLGGPETVLQCTLLASTIIGPGRICRFCFGGVRHPPQGRFTGYHPPQGGLGTHLEFETA